MVLYNAATKELTAKIVYYGPGLGGKTTNLRLLHDRLDPHTVGKLVTLSAQTDRTIYFDMLPVELGEIKGYKVRFQLATVPGQTAFNETRKVVLRGADGVVFVVDSRWAMLPKNLESWQNLKENLMGSGDGFDVIPIVVQYNKRDLDDVLSVDAMQEALGLSSYPFVEAVASAGRGITETFKLVSKLTLVDLLRRLQGRKPEEAAAAIARPALTLVPPPPEDSASAASDTAFLPPDEAPPQRRAQDGAEQDIAAPPPGPDPREERLAGIESRLSEISEGLDRERQESASLAGAAAAEAQARLAILEDRLAVLETRLAAEEETRRAAGETAATEAEGRLALLETRLGGEEEARRAAAEKAAAEAEGWLAILETRLEAGEQVRQDARRAAESALAGLSARAEKLSDEIAGALRQVSTLEASLEEKTARGLREAEDIRSQMAPLLAASAEGGASEERSLAEIERLRESLAASLAEVAERLRRAVLSPLPPGEGL